MKNNSMNVFATLIRREWLQHRFGWTLLALVPLALALLGLSFGQIQLDADSAERAGDTFPTLLAVASLVGGTVVTGVILAATSLIIITGLARRDHADRSVEFWLSLPTSHSMSLGAPLLTHLLLVPALALLVGLAGGWLVSAVLVTRLASFGAWLALPWGHLLLAGAALVARIAAGLPLAVLWVSPLLLAVVLANAYLKRWGVPALLLGLVILSLVLHQWLGLVDVNQVVNTMLRQAGQALFVADPNGLRGDVSAGEVRGALASAPLWALQDYGVALKAALSPLFGACVLVSVGLFALLVDWRQRGASTGS